MRTYLLDANVLIAATLEEHVHRARVESWLSSIDRAAVCPLVEGALVRTLVRAGEPASEIKRGLQAMYRHPRYEWWPDDASYAEVDLSWVRGHRQVTDAYLVGLARSHDATLATTDEALAATAPDDVLLVPA